MDKSNSSSLVLVMRIIPWRNWSVPTRVLSVLGVFGGFALFALLYLQSGSMMWGMILTFPTVIAGLAGGVVLGGVFGLAISAFPTLLSLMVNAEPGSSVFLIVAAYLTFTFLGSVVGYVAALTISHQRALAEIKHLREILPMCSHCRRVRDDEGYWSAVEDYVSRHAGVSFSHGLCDDCLHTYYPEHAEAVIKERSGREKLTEEA